MKSQGTPENWSELLRSGIPVTLLIFAFMLRGGSLDIAGLILFLLSSGFAILAWMKNLKFYRAIQNTPISSMTTTAQGYVKLGGYLATSPNGTMKSPITRTDCVWFRCSVPEGNKYGMENSESDAPFLLTDGEGKSQCIIEPKGADVFTHRRSDWREPGKALLRSNTEYRRLEKWEIGDLIRVDPARLEPGDRSDYFEEWLLLPGDPLLALGYLTSGPAVHRATKSGGQQLRLICPPDGRPFLLGTFHPRLLAWRYLFFALFNFVVFICGIWGAWSGVIMLH